ncbi:MULTISPECIES: histidine kinase [unclassified Streptomyces]|uniref:sensor histidine kinase n=1 Tax=unclassified Streptomyces TaxID=2593676 RepID=UPI0033A20822
MDVKRMLHLTGFGHRGNVDPARVLRQDALLAGVLLIIDIAVALTLHTESRRPDALGWTLLIAAHITVIWRRRAPLTAFLALVACVGPYHALNYDHSAPLLVSMTALFTVAVTGRPLRSLVIGTGVIGIMLAVKFGQGTAEGTQALRVAGWIVSFVVLGVYVRVHGQYFASVVERAERAERTREEEARRRVAEERLRIARDLHDLLAHSITLIGVQTSVAAHVLAADPDRLDRTAVAKALDDISETCRTARGELRTTLEVLRENDHRGGDGRGPLPGLDGLPDLVAAARAAGAKVESPAVVGADGVPTAVGAAAYRIVQEALTNAVRHAGPGASVRVDLATDGWALRVRVTDDGIGDAGGPPGFGLVGMRERARSVGGTLETGTREEGGFAVVAVLPLGTTVPDQRREPERGAPADGPDPFTAPAASGPVRDPGAARDSASSVPDAGAARDSACVRGPGDEPDLLAGADSVAAVEPGQGGPR